MQIAILGTGSVGQTLAGRFAELGHPVTICTRDVAATLARREPDAMGRPPLSHWLADHPGLPVVAYADLGVDADLVVNATAGHGSLAALHAVGERTLAGRVVLDVANPLDFSAGFPPTLFVKDTDSLAEQIQAAFPQVRVVKALNTMTAAVMVDPLRLVGGDHSVFVSGNDPDAKRTVTGLLTELGHRDVIDLGDITTARGTEMFLPLWLRLMGALGTPIFNVKVAR